MYVVLNFPALDILVRLQNKRVGISKNFGHFSLILIYIVSKPKRQYWRITTIIELHLQVWQKIKSAVVFGEDFQLLKARARFFRKKLTQYCRLGTIFTHFLIYNIIPKLIRLKDLFQRVWFNRTFCYISLKFVAQNFCHLMTRQDKAKQTKIINQGKKNNKYV